MPHATTPDGVKLYYEVAGTGTPILFVHEYSGDCSSWEPQVRHFSRDYRCITFNARGYPPSALATITKLVERAGNSGASGGSITGLYTVLADGDNHDDPVVDTARAILDGHLVLSRDLAQRGAAAMGGCAVCHRPRPVVSPVSQGAARSGWAGDPLPRA